MKYGYMVLSELLDRYNRSKHRKGEAKVNRSVRFPIRLSSFPEYFIDGLNSQTEVINDELRHLAKQDLLSLNWLEKDVLIDSVDLNIARIEEVHDMLGVNSLQEIIQERIRFFSNLRDTFQTPWILRFVEEALLTLERKKLPNFAKDSDFLRLLTECFRGIEEKGEDLLPERFFSKRYLNDSKAFERHLRSRIITIYKQHSTTNGSDLEDEDILQEIGIVKSLEEIQIWGDFQYTCEGNILDFSTFPFGTSLNGETIRIGEILRIGSESLLIIENKGVFREYIKRKREVDEVVLYIGGFPGPLKRTLFQQIKSWVDREQLANRFTFRFWGDIDLGGFRIFLHLKSSVLPSLLPFRMDVESFLLYTAWAEPMDESYMKTLMKLKDDCRYECFWPVIDEMSTRWLRLEQEAFYVNP